MGGSITLTTQAVARYMPSISSPLSHQGKPRLAAASRSERVERVDQQPGEPAGGHVGPADGDPEHHGEQQDHDREAPDPAGHEAVDGAIEVRRAFSPARVTARSAMSGGRRRRSLRSAVRGSRRRAASARLWHWPGCRRRCAAWLALIGRPPVCRRGMSASWRHAARSPSSPLRTAWMMRSSPSSRRSATQRALGRPGKAFTIRAVRSATARLSSGGSFWSRRGRQTNAPRRHLARWPASSSSSPSR